MFGLFKKKSEKEKLKEQYQILSKEAFRLSSINRKLSDLKAFDAEEMMQRLEKMS